MPKKKPFILLKPVENPLNLFADCETVDKLDFIYKDFVRNYGNSGNINNHYFQRKKELWDLDYWARSL